MANGSGAAGARVAYREQQVVARADLAAEQQYLIAARRRHNIGPHLWGIVSGLEVRVAAGVVSIDAGTAIDGYGRELTLAEGLDVPPSALLELNVNRVALGLIYDRVDRVVPLAGEWNCSPDAANRTVEGTRLRLTSVDDVGTLDPRQPADLIAGDREFAAQQDPPDDPAVLWPVFLGLVERDTAATPWQLRADYEARRPYAGLRGQIIAAASGVARVRAGHEVEGDNRAFAVETITAGTAKERLGVDLNGNIFLNEKTTVTPVDGANPVEGNLEIQRATPDVTAIRRAGLAGCEQEGDVERARFWGLRFDRIPPPAVATPWHLYHAGIPALPPPAPPLVPFDELRVEFLDPGKKGNRKGNRFVIGKRNAAGAFVQCITIDADCTVTVNGTLEVDGQVVMGPVQADPFDARLQTLILGGWLHGMLANTNQLATYYDGRVEMAVTSPPQAFAGTPFNVSVKVTNTGSIPLIGVRVTETHNLSTAQATLPAAFVLDPHEEKEVAVEYTVTTPGHLACHIAVTALAQQASFEVSASGDAAVDVFRRAEVDCEVQAQKVHAVVTETVPFTASIRNAGPEILSRVFFATAVDKDGTITSEDLLTNTSLQTQERRQFNRNVTRNTPGTAVIRASASASGAGTNNDDTATDQETVVFHTVASVSVAITDLVDSVDNDPIPFHIVVNNTGEDSVRLTTLQLTRVGTTPSGTFVTPAATNQLIASKQSLTLNASFTPSGMTTPGMFTLTVKVDISATGAGGDTDTATDTQSNTIAIN